MVDESSTVTVTITDEDGETVTATVATDSDGSFSVDVDVSGLADGELTVSVTATDDVGNTSDPATQTVTKDATAPVVTLDDLDDVDEDNGDAFMVSGTVSETSTVTVTVTDADGNTATRMAMTTGPDGSFSVDVDVSGLADGDLTVSVTATDEAGNTGNDTQTVTKDTEDDMQPPPDTTAPAAPMLDDLDDVDEDNDEDFVVSGTAEPGSTVTITVTDEDGTEVTGMVTAAVDGTFSLTLDVRSLDDGQLTVTATATDDAGSTSAPATQTVNKDTADDMHRPRRLRRPAMTTRRRTRRCSTTSTTSMRTTRTRSW